MNFEGATSRRGVGCATLFNCAPARIAALLQFKCISRKAKKVNSAKPSSLTIEEAVALMINLDYIPTGFSLLELLAAFQEEAEVELHNAKIDSLPADQLDILAIRNSASSARHSLAKLLTDHLCKEIVNPESSIFVSTSGQTIEPRIDITSLSDWASEHYGIDIQAYRASNQIGTGTDEPSQNVGWESITIKIYANHRLAYSFEKGPYKQARFQDIGLMGKRKNGPNHLGLILLDLCEKVKFPKTKSENKDAAAISKLRNSLKKMTGISKDPFYSINEADGWKPRFKLIDDRRNADERAKDRATHISYDERVMETPDFEIEKDAAQEFLDKNG